MRGRPSRPPLTGRALAIRVAVMTAVLAGTLVAAVSLGSGDVGPLGLLSGGSDPGAHAILLRIRLPHVLLAGLLGGMLTVSGIVFQALLRNPLADPYVLGVSGGASVGGVIALVLGLGTAGGVAGMIGVRGFAFLGALGALLVIERLATVDGRLTVYTVLLTGAIFNAFASALIYFLQSIATLEQLHDVVFYLMGEVPETTDPTTLAMLTAVGVSVTGALVARARDYNALSLGEDGAAQLGVEVERLKRVTFVLGSLLTALAVSVAGMIGFVGLVVPHVLRILFGPDHRVLLPAGFLGGATFLVLADLLARTVTAPVVLPVGVVTALVGGPFFLVLLRRRHPEHDFV